MCIECICYHKYPVPFPVVYIIRYFRTCIAFTRYRFVSVTAKKTLEIGTHTHFPTLLYFILFFIFSSFIQNYRFHFVLFSSNYHLNLFTLFCFSVFVYIIFSRSIKMPEEKKNKHLETAFIILLVAE